MGSREKKLKSGNGINIRVMLCLALLLGIGSISSLPGNHAQAALKTEEPAITVVEMQYEKLMKTYLNQIKLAFSEPDDARSLAMLHQFQKEFDQKTEALKKELQTQLKKLNDTQREILYSRLTQRAHVDELIALLFDERVSSRVAVNPDLKLVMDQLYAKSLEVQKSETTFIAAD